MFGFALKSTMFYIFWNKFKSQLITVLASIIFIAIVFSVYEDLYQVLKISSKEDVIVLFLIKWFIVFIILGFNWYQFKKMKNVIVKEEIKKQSDNYSSTIIIEQAKPQQHQNILEKKKLKTKTDVILQKYIK